MSFFEKLFKHVPKSYVKLDLKDYIHVDTYAADGKTFEIMKHQDTKIHIIVDVDENEIVGFKVGRNTY